MPKRAITRADQLRGAIAQEAARLMAEHGIQDFLTAKRKAAERYGVLDGSALPKNTEIEAALQSHQRLFGGPRHASSLQALRGVAVDAMRLLERFEPRLVGAVLHGTATEHSDVHLHVFADSTETVVLHLLDRRYTHEVFERKLKMDQDRLVLVPSVRFEIGTAMIETFVFSVDGIRQAPLSPVDGKPMRRAGISEAQQLLEQRSGGAANPLTIRGMT
jgi:hypothetical protein